MSSPSLDRMLRLHALARDISTAARKQLRAHLDTISALLRPHRLLGDDMEGAPPERLSNLAGPGFRRQRMLGVRRRGEARRLNPVQWPQPDQRQE